MHSKDLLYSKVKVAFDSLSFICLLPLQWRLKVHTDLESKHSLIWTIFWFKFSMNVLSQQYLQVMHSLQKKIYYAENIITSWILSILGLLKKNADIQIMNSSRQFLVYKAWLVCHSTHYSMGWDNFWRRTLILKYLCKFSRAVLEPVCCKKQQKKFLTSYWFVE